jgi:DNA-directed RNA polymerase III subunit RPC3
MTRKVSISMLMHNFLLILGAGSAEYAQTIHKLVVASYLKPSTILSHVSPRDKSIKYEAEEKAKITGFPTAKELREAKEVAEARLRREEEQAEIVGLVGFIHSSQIL